MARMSRLLDEALALDEAGRRPWLERATQEHPDLGAALREALLPGAAQAAELKALMSLPKLGAADKVSAPAASGLQPGARVGPYELIRLLGAGGMAEVWLARRADGAFKREVALKLPMLARAPAGLAARFARERDILASLEHPRVARLYDAGVDSQGLPYLAMEYVHGAPLTDWCDAHRLGIPERLELFLQVLEAVQYAHEKKVIHRDLKPSNILVTESGQVRLLDFGVAKLLEGEATDQPALTSVYGRALTPDYASPELLRGDPIDAHSDVYSLGVLLYELLTGTRPYRLKSAASIGLLDQAIATSELKKPSMQLELASAINRASTLERLARYLRGDLDAIALKALAKDPAHRYPSAAALAEDLRRHLDGKPIRARPARIAYRLGKLVLRNRALLGVSAVALAAILAAVGYARYRESVAQVTVSATAKNLVSDKSIAVLPFLDMSEHKDQEYFSDGLSEELIDMLTKIPELRVPARTSSFYFKGKQATITDIAKALGVAHVLEGSVRKSGNTLRVTAQLIRVDNGYHVWSDTYDRKLEDIFKVQDEIANAVVTALRVHLLPIQQTSAQEELRTANIEEYNLMKVHGTRNPAAYDAYLRSAGAYWQVVSASDNASVRAGYQEAVRLDPNFALAYAEWSIALGAYSILFAHGPAVGDYIRQAQAPALKAVALAPELAEGHLALALVRAESLDFAGASDEFQRVMTLAPGNARVLRDYGVFAVEMGRTDAGIAAARRATALDPLNANSHEYLSNALLSARRYDEAFAAYQDALSLSKEPRWRAFGGLIYYALGDFEKMRAECEDVRELVEDFEDCLALAYHNLGRQADAETALARLQTLEGNTGAYSYATIYAQWGNTPKALEWLETALQLRDPQLINLKTAPLLDPLRLEPRFKAIERELKFPP
jgi:serine/threonine protein kinase/TolB-like protein/Flp pilus assembly protein TadD